jgi:hypothetical protein
MYKFYGLLTIIILLFSTCGDTQSRRDKRNAAADNKESVETTSLPDNKDAGRDTTPVNINIYIENSKSIDGYLNGQTEFRTVLDGLLVKIKYLYDEENIHLHYINEGVHPIKEEISSFIAQLSPQTINVGKRSSTNLNNIFQQILERTDNATISVLISDCIYSIKGTNTTELLSREKNTIKDAFMTKSKNSGLNLATNILQFHSKFLGTYYNYKNKNSGVKLTNKIRPYYICMIGNSGLLSDFNTKIRYAELKGYRNNVFLNAEDYSSAINYTVLRATKRQGKFKPVKSKDKKSYNGIEEPETTGRNSGFHFALALDLKPLPVSYNILNDTTNYIVTKGNFKIENIYSSIELDALDKSDPVIKNAVKSMSHIIEFKATRKAFSSMSFAMKKAVSLPEWIENSNTENDSDINNKADEQTLGKTFGIKYMIEGIAEAYGEIFRKNHPDKALDRYFEIEIPVKN